MEKLKYKTVLAAIFLLALALRIIFIFSSPLVWWDEAVYANLGYDLSSNPFSYTLSDKGWSDYIPDGSWPNMGFRPPLLPYILSLLFFLKLDFMVRIFIPLIGALNVILVYLIAKKFADEKTGLIAALLFAFIPIHVFYSSRILNDVLSTFLISASILLFWKGFEEGNKNAKIFFGIVLALALLSRYTILWIFPVFLFYLLIRDKSLIFLKDKYLWISIFLFFIALSPWLFYSHATYGNILGAFIHGFKSSFYWGGVQPWFFFIQNHFEIFSCLGIVFLAGLICLIYKKEYPKNRFLLIWFFFFFIMASVMPHKEDRFIMPLIPPLVIICAIFLCKFKKIFLLSVIILFFSLYTNFSDMYSSSHGENSKCFVETLLFLNNLNHSYISVSDDSAIIYFYTKNTSSFYKDISLDSYNQENKRIYFIINNFSDMSTKTILTLEKLKKEQYRIIFNCSSSPKKGFIYTK